MGWGCSYLRRRCCLFRHVRGGDSGAVGGGAASCVWPHTGRARCSGGGRAPPCGDTDVWSRGERLVNVPAPQIRQDTGKARSPDRTGEHIVDSPVPQTQERLQQRTAEQIADEVIQPTPQARLPERNGEQGVHVLGSQIDSGAKRRSRDSHPRGALATAHRSASRRRASTEDSEGNWDQLELPITSASILSTFHSHRSWSQSSKSWKSSWQS